MHWNSRFPVCTTSWRLRSFEVGNRFGHWEQAKRFSPWSFLCLEGVEPVAAAAAVAAAPAMLPPPTIVADPEGASSFRCFMAGLPKLALAAVARLISCRTGCPEKRLLGVHGVQSVVSVGGELLSGSSLKLKSPDC